MINIGVISLGCDKNRVDTENMLYYLKSAGFGITSDVNEADVVIINTCAFIDKAKRESIDNILDIAKHKAIRPLKIIVTGCLPSRYKDKLLDALPEADAFVGIDDYPDIADIVKRTVNGERVFYNGCNRAENINRILTTDCGYAYLKIADGCDNHCTYCAIPSIRGNFRSRSINSLKEETERLIEVYGVKELILVAQDVTRYGADIYGKPELVRLLDELQKTDINRIRLLYCYPELVTNDLIKIVSEDNKICRYLDIPLQHINDRILKLMGRRTCKCEILQLIDTLKAANITLRSTFITGFPTETEQDFEELYDFIRDTKFDYAGFFAYSKEEDTPAARLKGQISKAVSLKRAKELSALQSSIIVENNKKYIGKSIEVLYEGIDFNKQLFYGTTERTSPDIDTKVYFKSKLPVEANNIYKVKIIKQSKLDLYGEVDEHS